MLLVYIFRESFHFWKLQIGVINTCGCPEWMKTKKSCVRQPESWWRWRREYYNHLVLTYKYTILQMTPFRATTFKVENCHSHRHFFFSSETNWWSRSKYVSVVKSTYLIKFNEKNNKLKSKRNENEGAVILIQRKFHQWLFHFKSERRKRPKMLTAWLLSCFWVPLLLYDRSVKNNKKQKENINPCSYTHKSYKNKKSISKQKPNTHVAK